MPPSKDKNANYLIIRSVYLRVMRGDLHERMGGNSNFLISQVVSRNVIAVLDIDSRNLNAFDETDRESLEKITGLIQNVFIIFRS